MFKVKTLGKLCLSLPAIHFLNFQYLVPIFFAMRWNVQFATEYRVQNSTNDTKQKNNRLACIMEICRASLEVHPTALIFVQSRVWVFSDLSQSRKIKGIWVLSDLSQSRKIKGKNFSFTY